MYPEKDSLKQRTGAFRPHELTPNAYRRYPNSGNEARCQRERKIARHESSQIFTLCYMYKCPSLTETHKNELV